MRDAGMIARIRARIRARARVRAGARIRAAARITVRRRIRVRAGRHSEVLDRVYLCARATEEQGTKLPLG